jgi:diguanylate cyclase (GGDEF)-like protein/PAS domain S-box-containing protein
MTLPVNRRLLVIDDNLAVHEDFAKIFAHRTSPTTAHSTAAALFGTPEESVASKAPLFELDFASQGQEGFAKVKDAVRLDRRYALAFVDMRMPPGCDGVQTIEKIWDVDPDLQIVICSAYDCSWEDLQARFGTVDRLLILKKPFDTAEVRQLACALVEKWNLARNAKLRLAHLQGMVEAQLSALRNAAAERQRSEQALRVSEARYALAVAAANDGLWDWDLSNGSIFYSARWKSMFGCADDEIGNTPQEWFSRVEPEDLKRLESELALHLDGRAQNLSCEYRIKNTDGKTYWMLCRGLAVRDAAGKPIRIAGSQTDITDRKLAEEKLRHDAMHDPLTGLANRTMLTDRLMHCMTMCKRYGGEFALVFLDLDRFKVVNDSLGHLAGDQLLIAFSRRLQTTLRELDTVARVDPGQLVRMGGDEFVVLMEKTGDAANAIRVVERIQRALSRPFDLGGQEVFTSCSVGISIGPSSYASPEDVLRDADTALYQAKAAGGGQYRVFDKRMHSSAVARLQTENEFRRALERQELRLYYQPIVSLQTGRVVELEALVRWLHPLRGLIPPSDFIPIAEETGMVIPMGRWVLREAYSQLRRWKNQFSWAADLSVAVNVSAKQFAHSKLVDDVEAALAESGIDPKHVHLELTESATIDCAANTAAILDRLDKLDVQLHLDDFGTGYSSLSHLQRMPFDALKIDRSFVAAMTADPASQSIVTAIVALAHSLKMVVIAEGVENQMQAGHLKEAKCDYVQGYLYSKPLPADQIVTYLANRQSAIALSA